MAIRNARSLTFRPSGVTDSVDATNARPGSMQSLANLVPASGSRMVYEPRPARTWFADFTPAFSNGQDWDTPTQITALAIIGNTAYGMITTRRFPGFDEPFVCDMTTGFFTPVLGVTANNVPASPPATGDWVPPIVAKVGTRILVTHPGFRGGVGLPATPAVSFEFVGNTHNGSGTLDGLLGFVEPGWFVNGPGIPAGAVVLSFAVVTISTPTITGALGAHSFEISDATGIVPGQIVQGFNDASSVVGTITAVAGAIITGTWTNSQNYIAQAVVISGNTITIDPPATQDGFFVTLFFSQLGYFPQAFGWFDISEASITKRGVTTTAGGAFATVADIQGLQPGMAVSGSGIPAGTMLDYISSTNSTVGADSPPATGESAVLLHYGLQKTDVAPFNYPVIGQEITGPGIAPNTLVATVTVIGANSVEAFVSVGLSRVASGSTTANPIYVFGGNSFLLLSQLATASATDAELTFTGGSVTAPLWAAGDTGINFSPSKPVGVSERNGRAWFACGEFGIPYSDSLLPCMRTFAAQALIPGNGLPVTATAGLQQESATTGSIAQATIAFQGAGAMQVITGDQATFDLAMNGLNVATGTLAPLSITPCTLGLAFVSPEGLRILNFGTHVSDPVGTVSEEGLTEGVTLPFLNIGTPSRMSAAANSDTIRIAAIDSRVPGEPIQEWWYHIPRKSWSGPHTLQTSLMERWANPQFGTDSFITAAADVPAKLYHSDSYVSGTSDFEEDTLQLQFLWRTSLLPDNKLQSMNAVVETLLSLALTGTQVLTVRMLDEYGAVLDEIELKANYNLPFWGGASWGSSNWYATNAIFRQHRLGWTKPLVFKQAFLEVEGDSQFGFQIGDFFMRWQQLGYQGPAHPRDPMIAGIAPLYGLEQALIIGNGSLAGTVIGPILAAPSTVFTGGPPLVGGSSVLGEGQIGVTNARFTLTLAGHASVPTAKEPLIAVTAFSDRMVGNSHANVTIDGFASSVILRGWAVGFAIRDSRGVLPPGTVIASIAPDGMSLTVSAAASQAVTGLILTVTGANLTVAWSPGYEPLAGTYPGEIRAEAPGYLPTYVPFLFTVVPGVFLTDPLTGLILTDADGLPLFTGSTPPPPIPQPPLTQAVTVDLVAPVGTALTAEVTIDLMAANQPLTQSVAVELIATAATALTQAVTIALTAQPVSGLTVTVPITLTAAQSIVSISPSALSYNASTAPAGAVLATFVATMSPASPGFVGSWSLSGPDAFRFTIGATTGVLSVGTSNLPAGTYVASATATQSGVGGSPFVQQFTVSVQAGAAVGYSAVVTMDSGPVFVFNPDSPDTHTSVVQQGNFVSDFAGFTQASVLTYRDDTPVGTGSLRVMFRKDIAPDPTRIEVILEAGYPTHDGSAANIGGFTLQILKAGVPQAIPYPTIASPLATSTSPHFPSMGWFSRWRWNPTPRAEARSRSSLLPSGLNLLPNYSAGMAATTNCRECGSAGGPFVAKHYSSAYTDIFPSSVSFPNDLNRVGINENCGIATNTGGVGDRSELGISTDWQVDYVLTGNALAQQTMYTLAEMAGGMPFAIRETTSWGPIDLVANAEFWGTAGGIDIPTVTIPSQGTTWSLETNHLPNFSYVPYILTGDPFYLENHQFAANWNVGNNGFHRFSGYQLNYADPNSPTAANPSGTIPLVAGQRLTTRGYGWALRDWGMFALATPASVPAWVRPRSYAQSVLDQNLAYAVNNSGCPGGTGANHTYVTSNYPEMVVFGTGAGYTGFEQGFFCAFLMMGLGFLVNQAGQSAWAPFYQYTAKLPIGWAGGTSGWPSNWPLPYSVMLTPYSTDYDGSPARFTSFTDMWNFYSGNQTEQGFIWANQQFPGWGSVFPAWQASHNYVCNSWILEVRAGQPVLPNVGDVASFTISGSFAGSPVTVSRTVTASDVSELTAIAFGSHSPNQGWQHPIADAIIASINASAAGTAGITAAVTSGAAAIDPDAGWWFDVVELGRIFLTFNSAVVGNIVCTGTYTSAGPNNRSSVYVQPNGDGVRFGTASAGLFGRPRNYQAARTASSGVSGPTGQALSTGVVDGAQLWYYVPEGVSDPFITPTNVTAVAPQLAQLWTNAPSGGAPQFGYALQAWCGLNPVVTAGIAGASTAAANARATTLDWMTLDSSAHGRYSFTIAP